MSASKEQKRSWYQRNKDRLSQERRASSRLQADIERFKISAYREFSVIPAIGVEEGYTFLDFLIEAETDAEHPLHGPDPHQVHFCTQRNQG